MFLHVCSMKSHYAFKAVSCYIWAISNCFYVGSRFFSYNIVTVIIYSVLEKGPNRWTQVRETSVVSTALLFPKECEWQSSFKYKKTPTTIKQNLLSAPGFIETQHGVGRVGPVRSGKGWIQFYVDHGSRMALHILLRVQKTPRQVKVRSQTWHFWPFVMKMSWYYTLYFL